MNIGTFVKEYTVDPVELPKPLRRAAPQEPTAPPERRAAPSRKPEKVPDREPVAV